MHTAMLRPLTSLWVMAAILLAWTSSPSFADDSIFCDRPANMDLCWWSNFQKRYLRFGRSNGDLFARVGRNPKLPYLGLRIGKRYDSDLNDYYDNNGYLRFGRTSFPEQSLLAAMMAPDSADDRRRRSVGQESASQGLNPSEEFVRWGRDNSDVSEQDHEVMDANDKKCRTVEQGDLGLADGINRKYIGSGRKFSPFSKRYLRFGRDPGSEGYLRFGRSISKPAETASD